MPLIPDGLDRGAHAIHVCWHHKLEKHRTVINIARLIVDGLIDNRCVTQVSLGRIFLPNGKPFVPRVQARAVRKRVEMTIFGTDAAQIILVKTKSNEVARGIVNALGK